MVTLRTHHNLEIQYNGRHALFIRVGPEYQEKLRGMCGNFNKIKEDDKVLPNGNRAKDDSEFGNSWISDTSPPGCANDPGKSEPCLKLPEFEQMCEILRNRSGPFSECHWHENPDPYYESCVYDLCHYGLGNHMLCTAIEAYDEMCTNIGVQLPDWRRALGCDVNCPANSYYDSCGTACAPTCANLTAPAECTEPCVAGCFCQEGYVLNDGTCVLRDWCSCALVGHFDKLEDQIILTDGCKKNCSCVQSGQTMECRDISCGALEVCKILKGVWGCHPVQYSTMSVSGYFHYVTLDGVMFDYQGACRYPLSKYCGPPGEIPAFAVYVSSEHKSSTGALWIGLIELDVYGERISVEGGQQKKVQVNGVLVNLPVLLASGKIYAYFRGSSVILQTDFGLSVTYDSSYYVSLSVPEIYSGLLCGLGGNFNGDQSDDFRTPVGSVVQDTAAFGDSWKDATCLPYSMATGLPSTCSETELAQYRAQNYCGVISNLSGPFKECHNSAGPQGHMESCARDLCATQGNRETLCKALQSYAWQCQVRGITIQPWRKITGCELNCPPNSRYVLCGSSCPASCAQPDGPPNCQPTCLEGCQCEPGFVLSGTDCVPREQCGCSYGGRHYVPGETFFWEGESCQKIYQCNGSTRAVDAAVFSCSSGEYCGIQQGVYGCHTRSDATCRASGFLHYTTFDGRRYDFPGDSRYVFVGLCGMSGSLPSLRVEVKNERLPNSPLLVTSEVLVMVNDTQILLQKGLWGTVKVDGVTVNLPTSLQALGITIYRHGFYTVLQTDLGLTVSYYTAHSLFVTLSPRYHGQTCGLCGNFNGVIDDDFVMQDGSIAKSVSDFAMEWSLETGLGGIDCSNYSYPELVEGELLIQSKSMCSIIWSPGGPFASCHSQVDPRPYWTECVFDLYVSAGDGGVLCQSVQTYAAACQKANVTISPWRKEISCTSDCWPNSHYKLSGAPCQDVCSPALIQPHCLLTKSEGCFCNEGYLLSGDSCIPEKDCGCEHGGLYYKIGECVWLDRCHKRCHCDGPSRFHCTAGSCSLGQECAIKDGKLGCQNLLATCTMAGDPHYFTFDGAAVHFQGSCPYELSRTCQASPHFFRVVAKSRSRSDLRVPFVTQVEVWLQNGSLSSHVVLGKGQLVEVNQEKVQLPHTLGALGNISRINNMLTVKTAANMELQYNGNHTLSIHVGLEYQGKLCGVCGNFNGIHEDDHIPPEGNKAQNDSQFGNN